MPNNEAESSAITILTEQTQQMAAEIQSMTEDYGKLNQQYQFSLKRYENAAKVLNMVVQGLHSGVSKHYLIVDYFII